MQQPDNAMFEMEPQTIRDYLRDIWHAVQEMKTQQGVETQERKELTRRLEMLERDVRDLRVFTHWVRLMVLTLTPMAGVAVAAWAALTR